MTHGGVKILISFFVILAMYITTMVTISSSGSEKTYQLDEVIAENLSGEHLGIFVQLTEIDPLKGEAKARILPWPNEESVGFTFRSGWLPNRKISIHVDSVVGNSKNGDNLNVYEVGVPTGGFDVSLDESPESAARPINLYPFDRYIYEVPISASYDESGETYDLAIFPQDYTKQIDTYDVRMDHVLWTDSYRVITESDRDIKAIVDELEQGLSSSIFTVQRSDSTKVLSFIIMILMLSALISVGTMTYMVAMHKRPPTLSSLTWSAALTFSLISLRGIYPGDPPIGILMDKVIYFPALLMTLVCSLWVLIMWSKREDYLN
jgi:Domain of unknown function (DUF4436)